MTNRSKFGFDDSDQNLFFESPSDVIQGVLESRETARLLEHTADDGYVHLEHDTSARRARLYVLPKAMTKISSNANHPSRKHVVGLLHSVANSEQIELDLSIPGVQMPTDWRSTDGRLRMYVKGRWPEQEIADAVGYATSRMRQMARDLKHLKDSLIDEMVYVQANREQGVVIETNPLGSCNIGASGSFYDPEDEYFELFQHNLYAYEQQLLCLVGAVGLTSYGKAS